MEIIIKKDDLLTSSKQRFNDTSITGVVIARDVDIINKFEFSGCGNIQTLKFERDPLLHTIEVSAFENTSLKRIYFPPSLGTIRADAFKNCTSLEVIRFGNNSCISKIEKGAFQNCINLKSLIFPKKIIKIYNRTFDFRKPLPFVALVDYIVNGTLSANLKKASLEYRRRMTAKRVALSKRVRGTPFPRCTTTKEAKGRHYRWYPNK